MNKNLVKKIKPKKNFFVALIADFIIYIVIFGIEYFMGKELDVWFSNHPGFVESILKWIVDNPLPSAIIIFGICFFGLALYDYKKSTGEEKSVSPSIAPVVVNTHHAPVSKVVDFTGAVITDSEININGESKKKDNTSNPKLPGYVAYPRWRYRNIIVKNGSLEQVIVCLKKGIEIAFWNWHDNEVWYEIDSENTKFYDPKTHDISIHTFVVHGIKNDIIVKESGAFNKILGKEERLPNMFTLTIEPAGFKQKVKIHIRLDGDYNYVLPFFDKAQKALEDKFGKNNVIVQP